LVFLEVSKVRSYHSTLMDGMLRGYLAAGLPARRERPVLYGHDSFYGHLGPEARGAVEYRPIPVIDQDTRRWLRKSLLETWVVLRSLVRMRRGDLLFVTTIMPSAMILVEAIKWLFPRRQMVVMQHGELDGAFLKEKQRLGSFGFYLFLWFRMRRLGSTTRVAVLDYFIADEIQRRFPGSVRPEQLHVVPLPMVPVATAAERTPGPVRCCFIGFKSPAKGYDEFVRLAEALPELEFRVIGGGQDRRYDEESGRAVGSTDDFIAAVGDCDIAVMPYVSGYDCSLSAAATDAVASGLHLLTSDRGCFRALAEAFGPETVTICADERAMLARLSDPQWLAMCRDGKTARLARVAQSHYSLASVGKHLDAMLDGEGVAPAPLPAAGTPRQEVSA
jgi:hypothetical protein